MRRFGTQGPVNPEQHYIVARTEELTEFIKRVKEGRYIVIFAPRQTGKTTFFYVRCYGYACFRGADLLSYSFRF